MRMSVLLPLCLATAAPAHAQQIHGITGIHINVGTTWGQSMNYNGPSDYPSGYRGTFGDMQRAQRLIASGDYAQADTLLANVIGKTSMREARFLKGVAKLGLGDPASARRYFEMSLYRGRNGYPGAMSGLALAEIKLGNRDAAENILEKLRDQQEKCGRYCDRAKPLDQAVSVVEKALA